LPFKSSFEFKSQIRARKARRRSASFNTNLIRPNKGSPSHSRVAPARSARFEFKSQIRAKKGLARRVESRITRFVSVPERDAEGCAAMRRGA
jgi:hypothetical protein